VRRMSPTLQPKSDMGKGSLMLGSGRTGAEVHRGRLRHSRTWTRGAMRMEGERGLVRWLEAEAEGDGAWARGYRMEGGSGLARGQVKEDERGVRSVWRVHERGPCWQ
jgi:hypothetical protein